MKHWYSKKTLARRLAYGKRRRREFVAAGLRSDGKPRAKARPCGCVTQSCLKCARPGHKLHIPADVVAAMRADYESGMTLEGVGRKYPIRNGKQRSHGEIRGIFSRRGIPVRPCTIPKLGFGVRIPEPSAKEIDLMISRLTSLSVPAELKIHWRRWSFPKRQAFVQKLRVKFPSTQPTGPFSKNVIPFKYGTQAAHGLAANMNAGRNSRTKVIALKPSSEGVIWNGQIFFWAKDCYVRGTTWKPGIGRPLLSHII